jgi:hypothetical protein
MLFDILQRERRKRIIHQEREDREGNWLWRFGEHTRPRVWCAAPSPATSLHPIKLSLNEGSSRRGRRQRHARARVLPAIRKSEDHGCLFLATFEGKRRD